MTRADLEAVIWQNTEGLTSRIPAARRRAMAAILCAADNYATAEAIRARRRRETMLAALPGPDRTVHLLTSTLGLACGAGSRALCSSMPAEVTCQACTRTTAFGAAW